MILPAARNVLGAALCAALALLTSVPLPAYAQQGLDVEAANRQIERLRSRLADPAIDEDGVADIARQAIRMRAGASACKSDKQRQIDSKRDNLRVLEGTPAEEEVGPQPLDESDTAELIEQRTTLEQDILHLQRDINECSLVQLNAEDLVARASHLQRDLSAKRLSSQGATLWTALIVLLADIGAQGSALADAISARGRLGEVGAGRWLIVVLTTIFGLGVGWLARRELLPWSDRQRGHAGQPAVSRVLVRALANPLPVIFAGGIAAAGVGLYTTGRAHDLALFRLAFAVFGFGIGRALIDWYTGPHSPGAKYIDDDAELRGQVRNRLTALLVALLAGYLVFGRGWLAGVPPQPLLWLRSLLTIYLVASLIWVLRIAQLEPRLRGRMLPARAGLFLASLTAVAADLAGYRNFANYLLQATLGTLLGGLVIWTLLWGMRRAVDSIVSGTTRFSYRVRAWLGMRPDESSAELGWLRFILSVILWVVYVVMLIGLWDTTGNAITALRQFAEQGMPIGDSAIVPRDVLIGLAVFGGIIALTAWVKAGMSKRWLRDLGMERGSREALITLTGYIGIVIAAIVGVAMAGFDFRGLAIAVAALSVGIGFGLQNVVNNFVSGLILLFERPIKSGDFVSVGDVEGVVRQIRIRSTEIETLDRRNVIVPNSELVATRVTNWMLHDPHGRLRVKVGVAYGSDTVLVKQLLEEIANNHPEVIKKGRVPGPRALFMAFGDSSLDFELRVWIRHIEQRFSVTSELNFAIDQSFREHGITIPFPQRDVHLLEAGGAVEPAARPAADVDLPGEPPPEK